MRTFVQRTTIFITVIVSAVWFVCAAFLSAYWIRYIWATSKLKTATAATSPIFNGLRFASMSHIKGDWAAPTVFCSLLLLAVLVLNVVLFAWCSNRSLN